MPTVSVIIPSYNHEKFIGACIQSALNQTFQDFEIIITDDGSSDRTVEVIESFRDPRITLFKHTKNQGVCVAANNCISHARGKYIAWLSSDDEWYPEKLAVQVKYLDEHSEIAVVFGKVDWIDEYGNPIKNSQFPYMNVFEVENRSRFEWLNHFFLKGNCLSLPCSLVRTEYLAEVGMFDRTFANIQDFDLWIRICHKANIHILDQKLIKNRWISEESNASGDNIKTRIRVRFEHKQSLNHYLQISNPDELLLIFPFASKYGEVITDTIPYLLGRIAIDDGLDFKMLWGLDVIYGLLQNEKTAQILDDKCNFTCLDFIKLTGKCDTFRITVNQAQPYIKVSAFRRFLSASKQYITEIFKIILQLFGRV
jgi:GT2 family glycosyltransferase